MNDDLDIYLGRSLKKCVAGVQPPAGSRERLLKAAASMPVQQERRINRMFYRFSRRFLPGLYSPYAFGGWSRDPLAQSRLWYFHMTIDSRMAT